MDLKDKIRASLAGHTPVPLDSGPVPAAVLLPLFLKNGVYHILFTKRTALLNHHGGEISFPGGVCHPEDTNTLQTALRETWEEVGIAPDDVDVLGQLDDVLSIHNYLVTPYVGMLPADCRFRINSAEIEQIMEVSLSHLRNPDIFRSEDWTWKGHSHPVYFYTYREDDIWGLTAAILKQFLDVTSERG